jgi:hypothetical protein
MGLFLPGSAERLGFTSHELEEGRQYVDEMKNLEALSISDVASLRSSEEYKGGRTELVFQDDAAIIEPDSGLDGLYAFGACTCSILAAVSRDAIGAVRNVGIAHIDAMVPVDQITLFLDMVRHGKYALEASVIGGYKTTFSHIVKSCKDADADIVFCRANMDGERVDCAIAGSDGSIYYGSRPDLRSDLTDTLHKADYVHQRRIMALSSKIGLDSSDLPIRTVRYLPDDAELLRKPPEPLIWILKRK